LLSFRIALESSEKTAMPLGIVLFTILPSKQEKLMDLGLSKLKLAIKI